MGTDYSHGFPEDGEAHLIRDFVAFSWITPADYLRRLLDLRNDGTHPH